LTASEEPQAALRSAFAMHKDTKATRREAALMSAKDRAKATQEIWPWITRYDFGRLTLLRRLGHGFVRLTASRCDHDSRAAPAKSTKPSCVK
jgi:hypothetical protein